MHLGLHCSRQSFTATITDSETSEIVLQKSIHYDDDLSHRDTVGGFIKDPNTKQSYLDPQMLVEALDTLFETIHDRDSSLFSEITTISGSSSSATVFLNQPISDIPLNPSIPLTDQLRKYYSHRASSITRDNSAANAAELIRAEFASSEPIRNVTGVPITSHTGAAQIKKIATELPHVWEMTTTIHTCGSFLCSLLIGEDSALDVTDSSQLGLVDIKSRKWHTDVIDFVAPNLLEKLPELVEPPKFAGFISDYFKLKYGFSEKARCLAWISEEAAYCLGAGNLIPGEASLSLDETYSLSVCMKTVPAEIPNACKVTIHPLQGYIGHVSLSNGVDCLIHTAKKLGIEDEEINSHLEALHTASDDPHLPFLSKELSLNLPSVNFDHADIMSVVNGQLLHLKLFSQWIDQPMNSLIISGECAKLPAISQICADIYQAPSHTLLTKHIPTIGTTILEEIYLDTTFKVIKNKYHSQVFSECKLPEPYMANIYNISLNKYHKLLIQHLEN